MDKDSTDSGEDLVVMHSGSGTGASFPRIILSGVRGLSSAVWSPTSSTLFMVQCEGSLTVCETDTMKTWTWFKLPAGETFEGCMVWCQGTILFATNGGSPKRSRLYSLDAPVASDAEPRECTLEKRRLMFTAEHGGGPFMGSVALCS